MTLEEFARDYEHVGGATDGEITVICFMLRRYQAPSFDFMADLALARAKREAWRPWSIMRWLGDIEMPTGSWPVLAVRVT